MAGRRPTVSTNLPAGSDGDRLGHRGEGEGDAGPGRRPVQHLDHQHRDERGPDPERGPALGEVGEAGGLVAGVAQHRTGTGRRRSGLPRAARRAGAAAPARPCRRRPACRRRRRTVRSARSPTGGRRPPGRSCRRSGSRPGRTRPPDRGRPASTEVSSRVNADTVNIAEPMPPTPRSTQQLHVAVRDAGQPAGDRDDEDADRHHDALAEEVDQPAAERAGHQPHQREGRDHRADLEVARPRSCGRTPAAPAPGRRTRPRRRTRSGPGRRPRAATGCCRGPDRAAPPVCSPASVAACALGGVYVVAHSQYAVGSARPLATSWCETVASRAGTSLRLRASRCEIASGPRRRRPVGARGSGSRSAGSATVVAS